MINPQRNSFKFVHNRLMQKTTIIIKWPTDANVYGLHPPAPALRSEQHRVPKRLSTCNTGALRDSARLDSRKILNGAVLGV